MNIAESDISANYMMLHIEMYHFLSNFLYLK